MPLLIATIATTLLLIGPCLLVVLVYHLSTRETYPSEAAESPSLDCGCRSGGVTYTCMHCQHTRCGDHRDQAHVCPDRDGDLVRTEGAGSPAIVAGEDLVWADRRDMERVAEQFKEITEAMPELELYDGLAIFYLRPEVTQ
jgi:hypothetical protein